MSNTKGFDVSEFQSSVDFKSAKKDGYEFVIIRAGYGRYSTQKDTKFDKYVKDAHNAGFEIGSYWLTYAQTTEEAREEADLFCDTVEATGYTFNMPLYCDVEVDGLPNNKTVLTNIVYAFCEKLEERGYYAGIYCNVNFAQNRMYIDEHTPYDVWLADYSDADDTPNINNGMWQYTNAGTLPGTPGAIDLDRAYIDYPATIKSAGLNRPNKSKNSLKEIVKNFVESVGKYLGDA